VSSPDDVRASAARNLAAWHDTSLRALGCDSRWSEDLWWSEGPTPAIYLSAITLAPGEPEDQARRIAAGVRTAPIGPVAVWDSFASLDLGSAGLVRRPLEAWFVRDIGTWPPPPDPPGLVVEEVHTADALAAFEAATLEGFEGPKGVGRYEQHAPGILADPAMHAYAGTLDGRVVSVSMSYVGEDVVGVYGVATVRGFRRRGFGSTLTWRAAAVAPDRPALLQPSQEGVGVYRSLGFRLRARSRPWWREESGG
jgi:hypothetical protein